MIRLIGAFAVVLATLAVAPGAHAQVLLQPCSIPQLPDPGQSSKRYPPGQVVGAAEVIVDGVIESYGAAKADAYLPRPVVLRVNKVWKGDVTPRVILLVNMDWYGPDMATWEDLVPNCSNPVQIGQRIRIGAEILGKNDGPTLRDPDLDLNTVVLSPGDWRGVANLPLRDQKVDRFLKEYQAKTERLRQAAEADGQQGKLAFAGHLLANNEEHRAFSVYDALVRENPDDLDLLLVIAVARSGARIEGEPEATLAMVRERAPKTEKWLSKIARARLAATSLLTAEGKDWSDLKRMHTTCYSDHENFDGTIFDRAELPECAFRYSSFRNASFRGTDLTGAYFQNSDLTGAQYDCATKLPDDLDPKAAGMINVEGNCAP